MLVVPPQEPGSLYLEPSGSLSHKRILSDNRRELWLIYCGSFTQHFLPLQIKYHEEFEKSRMGPSGGEGMEPERRDSQDSSSYRRPQEPQQPHHIPTSAPGEHEACGVEDLKLG